MIALYFALWEREVGAYIRGSDKAEERKAAREAALYAQSVAHLKAQQE